MVNSVPEYMSNWPATKLSAAAPGAKPTPRQGEPSNNTHGVSRDHVGKNTLNRIAATTGNQQY